MNSEIEKQKYSILQTNLKLIKSKLHELEISYNELISNIKECLLVDEQIINKMEFDDIKKTQSKILLELTNNLIPEIGNKI